VTRIVEPKQIIFYADADGNEPFQVWLDALRDTQGRRRIIKRLFRVQQGNYGDVEPIGEELSELRLFFGPGYRVYFGGGDKDSQDRDIENEAAYWQEYQTNAKTENP
jgi:putative addiction module killer protein